MALTTILASLFVGAPVAIFFLTQALYILASALKNQTLDYYARCAASLRVRGGGAVGRARRAPCAWLRLGVGRPLPAEGPLTGREVTLAA